jgi:large repetitive protein
MKISYHLKKHSHSVILVLFSIFLLSLTHVHAQMAKCKGKYLGNIIQSSTTSGAGINYNTYWNQATSENGSKWGSVESTQGVYNWTNSDIAYNWAKNNNGLFKYHNFVWGSQTPSYVSTASTATLTAAVENYIKACSTHYTPMGGIKMIDVLNEPVNTAMPGNLKAALTAGYKADPANAADINNQYGWAIWPYQLARKYFPNAVLLVNEYNTEMNWNNCRPTYLAIANAIKNAPNLTDGQKNLIDGIGLQCHGVDNLTAANFKSYLDEIWTTTGLPAHITEFDQAANPNESTQTSVYTNLIPVAWEHPHVAGITMWGYVQGFTWINGNGTAGASGTDSGIMYSGGTERPALTWLKGYMAGQPSLSCCPLPAPFASCATGASPTVSLTAPADGATFAIGANITLTATAADADGTITKVEFYNGTTKLGQATTSPYSFTWTSVPEGNYTITAVATDNSGNATTSTAISITVGNPQVSLLNNGEFDNGTTGWTIQNNSGATGTMTVVTNGNLSGTNSLRICAANAGTADWHVQVSQAAPIVAGKMYTISFMAKADAARTMTISLQQGASPYATYFAQPVNLTTAAQTFTFQYTATTTDASDLLKFFTGNSTICVNIDKVSVMESNFAATITAGGPTTFCQGGNVVLNGSTGTGFTYQWNKDGAAIGGATAASYTATLAGSYTVDITENSVTSTSAAVVVTVNALPSAPTVTSPVTYCQNATATALTATGTALQWYTVSTGGTGSATAPTPSTATVGITNYYVSQTASGCEGSRATLAVTINALPAAPTVSPVTYCQNATPAALTASGTALKWYTVSTGGTGSATAPSPSTATVGTTNYYVSQTISGCEGSRATLTVTVNSLPSSPTVSPVTYCQNTTATALTASGTSLLWYTASTGGTGSSTAPTPPTTTVGTTNYYVSQTISGCEGSRATLAVTINALPAAPTVSPVTYCQNATPAALTASGTALKWYTVSTGGTGSATAPAPSTATVGTTTYYVSQTISGCEGGRATLSVTINSLPSAPAVSPVSYCQSATASALTATGTALQWYTVSTGGTGSATAPTPSTATLGTTNYYVSQTLTGCESARSSIAVTVNAAATATIASGGATTFCQGGNVMLTANTGSSYIWFNGATQVGTGVSYTANTSGNYTVQITNPSGCTGQVTSAVTTVTVNAIPSAPTVNGPVTYCQNATATALTATGTALQWYSVSSGGTGSATAPTPSTFTAGTTNYYVSQTISGCESGRATLAVTVNAAPSAPAVSTVTYCQNATATALTATGTALQWYSVSSGGTGSATAPTPSTATVGTTNYYVSQTISGCESGRAALAVSVNALPSAPAVSPVTYCQNATATILTATGTALQWYTVSTGGTGSATAPTPSTGTIGTTNYYVSQTTNNCESARAVILVTINSAATATISASGPTSFCQGGSVTLTANSGSSYIWFNGTTQVGTSSSYTANTSGSYTVQVSNPSGCVGQVTSGATTVTVNSLPTATITAIGNTSFCQGGSVTLTSSAGSSYKWFNGASQVGTSSTYTASTAGNYTVEVTNGSGCKATSSATTVTVNALPAATVNPGGPTSFCSGGSVILTASAGSSYIWFNGAAQVGTNSTYTATASGNYTVEVTNASGCKATSSATAVTVNALPSPTITVGGNTSFCQGGSVTLTASVGSSYIWYNGASQAGTNSTYIATASGNYTVEITNGSGCKASSSATTVTVNALPVATITAGGPTNFCPGGSVVLTSSAGSSYVWFNGVNQVGTNSTYTATTAGSYTLEVTNAAGCKATSSATAVTINSTPTATITAGGPTSFCQGGNVVLTASAGSSYLWFNGAAQVGSNSSYTATTAGNYTVQVTIGSGCNATSAATAVTVNALPAASITAGGNTTFCQGGNVALTASSGSSYIWFNGAAQAGTGSTYTASTTGNYTVEVTNASGCKATSSATAVTVNSSPAANITAGGSTSLCSGGSVTLTASTGSSYIWFNGASQVGTSSTYTAATAGDYTVEVTNGSGCMATSPATTVTINALPTASITAGGNTTFCQGSNVVLTASAGSSYIWFNGAAQVGTNSTYTAATSGNYTVEVTNASGCKATSSAIAITVNALPAASITAGGATTFSQGGSVVLSANTGTGLTYKWFNGPAQVGSNSTYTATSGGNYTVEVTNAAGCMTTSSAITVTVTGNQQPIVNITFPANNATFTAPANVSITATATDPDGTVTKVDFYFGNTLLGTDPTSPYNFAMNSLGMGSYTILAVATDNQGGTATSSSITFTVTNPLPTVSITAPSNGASFVESATIPITANAADANGTVTKVQFYNGSTLLGTDVTSPYSFTWSNVAAGTYDITAKATDNDGGVSISSIVTITVTANQPSVITITSPTNNSTVTGNSVTINVTATDPDGGITLVEYLDGTTVIGSSTTQPYSYTWNNPPAGTHNISVRVTDSNGGVTTSSPTTMIVQTQTGIFTSGYGTFTNVYPNPSLDVFTFKASEEIKSLSIVNMHGIEQSTLQNIQAGEQVEIGKDLAEGSFVLLIKYTSGRVEVGKLVKIK